MNRTKISDLLMRPSPFIRSFGDMSSSMIVILISIGRLVMVTLEPSEFGPGRLVASALRSETGLHHTKTGRGGSVLTEGIPLHSPRIRRSLF